jgi:hypothetical protein
MTGPVDTSQDQPLDPAAYTHQLLLLKSAHCARPVLYRGVHQFISGLTLHSAGTRPAMVVYLAGRAGGLDSTEVQIKTETEPV